MIRADNNTAAPSDNGNLTAQQRQLLSYFSSMDEISQQFVLSVAESNARVFPQQRPQLRVVGGAS